MASSSPFDACIGSGWPGLELANEVGVSRTVCGGEAPLQRPGLNVQDRDDRTLAIGEALTADELERPVLPGFITPRFPLRLSVRSIPL